MVVDNCLENHYFLSFYLISSPVIDYHDCATVSKSFMIIDDNLLEINSNRRQCGRVVRAPDLESGGPGFKSPSDHYLELFLGSPKFNSSASVAPSSYPRPRL